MKRSEPDGVRPNLRRAVCDFQQSKAAAENHSLPQGFPFAFLMGIKKAGGLSPASRLNHLAGAVLIQSNACSSIRASTSKSALP